MLFLNRYTPRIYYANGKVASVHYLHGVLDIQHTEYYIKRNDSFNKIWFHKKYHNISLYGQYVLDKSLCPLFWNLLFLMMLSRMCVQFKIKGAIMWPFCTSFLRCQQFQEWLGEHAYCYYYYHPHHHHISFQCGLDIYVKSFILIWNTSHVTKPLSIQHVVT